MILYYYSENDIQLAVYPNPTNDNINFNLKEVSNIEEVSILDISGKVVETIYQKGIN